ncbi:hypothetical protein VTP01DRAFT_4742 [Rhizomucor pusillus]|uniref:uncharacterized protein n=1 Tax=Rhizomucor pusillus TaxID=4840 RepID=UPI003743A383
MLLQKDAKICLEVQHRSRTETYAAQKSLERDDALREKFQNSARHPVERAYHSSSQQIMAEQLTRGVVKRIYDDQANKDTDKPTVQILNIKSVTTNTGTRFRVIVSDGVNFMQAMLASQHSALVENKELQKFSIIRLTEYVCNAVSGRRILIILHFDIIKGQYPEKIGNPTTLENPATTQANTTTDAHSTSPAAANINQPTPASGPSPTMMQRPSSGLASLSGSIGDNQNIYPIKGLNPYQNKWTIRARVTQKSDIKHWHNSRGDGKLFSVNLLDNSGEIKGTAFNDQVDRLYNILEEGKVYYISKARVTMARKQFSTVDHEYELSLDNGTEIQVCHDEGSIPQVNFSFVKVADVDRYEKGAVIDLIGIVKDDNGVQEIITKATGRPTKKRELLVVDDTQKQIRLTLWDKHAEDFDSSEHPVTAFKGLRVNDFNGRSLSLSASGLVRVNPDIPECAKLKQWYKLAGSNASYSSFSNQGNASLGQKSNTKITLGKAKEDGLGASDTADYFSARVTIAYIKPENLAYPACPDCKKKVMMEDQGWRCEKCSKMLAEPTYRFLLTMSIEDHTSQTFVQAFDEIGSQIFGTSANELMKLQNTDPDAYSRALADALFKTYNAKIRAKMETFNDNTRTRYQLIECSPISWVDEGREMANAIQKYF